MVKLRRSISLILLAAICKLKGREFESNNTISNFIDTQLLSYSYSHCVRQEAGYCCVEYSVSFWHWWDKHVPYQALNYGEINSSFRSALVLPINFLGIADWTLPRLPTWNLQLEPNVSLQEQPTTPLERKITLRSLVIWNGKYLPSAKLITTSLFFLKGSAGNCGAPPDSDRFCGARLHTLTAQLTNLPICGN